MCILILEQLLLGSNWLRRHKSLWDFDVSRLYTNGQPADVSSNDEMDVCARDILLAVNFLACFGSRCSRRRSGVRGRGDNGINTVGLRWIAAAATAAALAKGLLGAVPKVKQSSDW